MATEKEIELACDIQRIGIQINMQGKYHAFVNYIGHVNWLEVRVLPAPFVGDAQPVKGWHGIALDAEDESYVTLSTGCKILDGEEIQDVIDYKVESLEKLKAGLLTLLEVDADGVPL